MQVEKSKVQLVTPAHLEVVGELGWVKMVPRKVMTECCRRQCPAVHEDLASLTENLVVDEGGE